MDRFQEVVSDHRKLIEAFVQEDAEKAERVVRRHYERSGEIIVGLLESEDSF
jgi:DNA-binding FadR family transcriptional regulator